MRHTAAASRKNVDDVAALLDAGPHDRVLLDAREVIVETDTVTDYEQASYTAEVLTGRCVKLAILGREEDQQDNDFFETVCQNRGLELRFFLDEAEAIAWLRPHSD